MLAKLTNFPKVFYPPFELKCMPFCTFLEHFACLLLRGVRDLTTSSSAVSHIFHQPTDLYITTCPFGLSFYYYYFFSLISKSLSVLKPYRGSAEALRHWGSEAAHTTTGQTMIKSGDDALKSLALDIEINGCWCARHAWLRRVALLARLPLPAHTQIVYCMEVFSLHTNFVGEVVPVAMCHVTAARSATN